MNRVTEWQIDTAASFEMDPRPNNKWDQSANINLLLLNMIPMKGFQLKWLETKRKRMNDIL